MVSGEVPTDWRLANIFALHTKGPKDLLENYRPISLTFVLSKILEHIVLSGISNFLENNKLIIYLLLVNMASVVVIHELLN